jgi:NADPH:quinone reductase-like Zn-dependent oxidoreductase
MRAVVLRGHGGLEQLVDEIRWPEPGVLEGEVLVRVAACGVNNTDVNTRVGWYADGGWRGGIAFPRIQGAAVCGYVGETRVLVDPYVRDPAAPHDLDRVTCLGADRNGGFAELVAVPTANVHAIDSPLTDAELASFPTSSITALAMLERVNVRAGELVLVTGASGGVGSALVQLVRARGGTPVAVCAADKAQSVAALGAAATVDRDEPLPDRVDVVADVVGGVRWPELIRTLRRGGRYVTAGAIAGSSVDLDLRTLYLRDLTIAGATVPPPHLFGELVRLIEASTLRPAVAATYPLERLREAQEAFMAKRHVGKIVIEI